MNKQEFNRLAAELSLTRDDFFIDAVTGDVVLTEKGREFNPYDDANDMLLLEEKLSINTEFLGDQRWLSSINNGYRSGSGKTPHESRRACAEEYLKEWKK